MTNNIEGRVLKIEGMGYRHKPRFMVECRLNRIRNDNIWIKTIDGQYVFEEHSRELDCPIDVWDKIETIPGTEKVIPAVEKYFTQGHPNYKSVDAVRARHTFDDEGHTQFELYILREEEVK